MYRRRYSVRVVKQQKKEQRRKKAGWDGKPQRTGACIAARRCLQYGVFVIALVLLTESSRGLGVGRQLLPPRGGGLRQLPLRPGPACCSSSCKQVQTWAGRARAADRGLSRQLRGVWLTLQLCLRAWSMRRWRRMRLLTRGARYEPRRASSLARITRAWRSTSTMGGCQERGMEGGGRAGQSDGQVRHELGDQEEGGAEAVAARALPSDEPSPRGPLH